MFSLAKGSGLFKKFFLFLLIIAGIAGFVQNASASSYKVGPKDTLEIIVFDEPDAGGIVTVNPEGKIQHNLLGLISVKNLSADEIQALLTKELKRFIRFPNVTVTILAFNARKVYVFGGVTTPGQFPLKENTTLLEILIKEAGGTKGQAGTIQILRNYLNKKVMPEQTATSDPEDMQPIPSEMIRIDFNDLLSGEGGLSRNIILEDGDIIYVPSDIEGTGMSMAGQQNQVYVFGAVSRPGIYPLLGQNYTALNAVLDAGGFSKFAAENRVRLIRKLGDNKKERIVRLGDVMKGQKEKDVILQANDVLVVPEGLF